MSDEKRKRQRGSKHRGQAAYAMPRWKALLLLGVMLSLAGVLVWFGLAIVVRCDRVREARVDVTVERRFLGFLTLSTETVPDVIKASGVFEKNKTRRPGESISRTEVTEKLVLTPRHGPEWHSPLCTPSFGTRPKAMAQQIEQFIKDPSRPSLTTWWIPWLVNVAAFFIGFFPLMGLGEVLLRALGFIKPA